MMLQIEFWQLVGMAAGSLCTFAAVLWVVIQMGMSQARRYQDGFREQVIGRLEALDETNKEASNKAHQLEKDMLSFRLELAEKYVRREDYILGQAVLEAKLDKVYEKLEVVQLKGERNVG